MGDGMRERYAEIEKLPEQRVAKHAACRAVNDIAVKPPEIQVSIPDQLLVVERLTQRPFEDIGILDAKPELSSQLPASDQPGIELPEIHVPVDAPAGQRRLKDEPLQ